MMAVPPVESDGDDGCDGDAVGKDDDDGGGGEGAFSSLDVTTVPATTADRRMTTAGHNIAWTRGPRDPSSSPPPPPPPPPPPSRSLLVG